MEPSQQNLIARRVDPSDKTTEHESYTILRYKRGGKSGALFLVLRVSDGTPAYLNLVKLSMMCEEEKAAILESVSIMQRLDHENIIKCRDVYFTRAEDLCVVSELVEGGGTLD